jgi:hypothetical protein
MKEMGISKFRVKCSAIIERVRKTRQAIRVTRFGQPVGEIVLPSEGKRTARLLGSMVGAGRIIGDIVGPTGSLSDRNAAAEADENERGAKRLQRSRKLTSGAKARTHFQR